jgi:tetratricopeptide (TPR) repeat protein
MDADPEAALQSARETLDWALRHDGPDSPMTLNAQGEVAVRLERLGRLDEALPLRREAAERLRVQLGPDEPSTLTAEGFEGLDLDRLGRSAEALPLFEHILTVRAESLGGNDALTLSAMEWLGCTQRNLGDLPASRRLLQDAVERYEENGTGETEDCMKATSHLASTLFQLDLRSEVCRLRRHIVEVRTRTLGPDDPATLRSLESLAVALWRVGELEEAGVTAGSLLRTRARLLGDDHADTQLARDMLAGIERTPG